MESPLELVAASVPLLDAAVSAPDELERLLGAAIAPGWAVFPESLPLTRAMLATDSGWQKWGVFFFVLRSRRTLVGFAGFKGPPASGVVEIGYAIAPGHRGRGFATAAARELITQAFHSNEVHAVEAHTLAERNASTRILEKLGMERIAEMTDPTDGPIWRWRLKRTSG